MSAEFQATESDLLYSVPLREHGRKAFVYFLFEHQSTEDPWIAFRLLHYALKIWQRWRADNPASSRLPIIVPVVLAQNEKRWKLEPRFSALFDLTAPERDDFAEYLPDFLFQLIQLAEIPFEKIVGTPLGVITLRILKAERIHELLGNAVWDEALLRVLNPDERAALYRYIARAADVDTETFKAKIQALRDHETRAHAMSVADRLIQEGREEGRVEGLEEGLERGEIIGRIRMLQDLLHREETPTELLAQRSMEELRALRDELRKALA